nr:hypothetical protein [Methanoculleus marisnigri]
MMSPREGPSPARVIALVHPVTWQPAPDRRIPYVRDVTWIFGVHLARSGRPGRANIPATVPGGYHD